MRQRLRRAAPVLLPILVGLVGAWIGMTLGGATTQKMGPFDVRLEGGFGRGITEIALPPMGQLVADTHRAPMTISATLWNVDVPQLTELLQGTTIQQIAEQVERDAMAKLGPLSLRLLAVALAGALVLSLIAFRARLRPVALAVAVAFVAVGGSQTAAWRTFDPAAFTTPTFRGSLELAPQLVGSVGDATGKIEDFRAELQRVVSGAVQAYTRLDANLGDTGDHLRVLHISDIHLSPLGLDLALQLARSFEVDLVLDTGDLTSFATPPEELILSWIPRFRRPYVFARGNHDSMELQEAMREIPNAHVLDGEALELEGLLFYGLGHPAFTENSAAPLDHPAFVQLAESAGLRIAADLRRLPRRPDIVAVHDDRMVRGLAGRIPLVVSGHYHASSTRVVDGTIFLRAGSTGGSGVNVFTEQGTMLTAQILYFDRDRPRLVAYDRIRQDPSSGSLLVRRHLAVDDRRRAAEGRPEPTPAN